MKVPRLHSVCVVVELNVPDEPVELGVAAHIVGGAGEGGHLPRQDGDVARGVEGEVGASVQAGELRAGTAQHLQTH